MVAPDGEGGREGGKEEGGKEGEREEGGREGKEGGGRDIKGGRDSTTLAGQVEIITHS